LEIFPFRPIEMLANLIDCHSWLGNISLGRKKPKHVGKLGWNYFISYKKKVFQYRKLLRFRFSKFPAHGHLCRNLWGKEEKKKKKIGVGIRSLISYLSNLCAGLDWGNDPKRKTEGKSPKVCPNFKGKLGPTNSKQSHTRGVYKGVFSSLVFLSLSLSLSLIHLPSNISPPTTSPLSLFIYLVTSLLPLPPPFFPPIPLFYFFPSSISSPRECWVLSTINGANVPAR